ncbi:hypothetical protein IQ247_14805 [Plectonema cf. radiosum LEGE 06105]|uniref:Lipoprotein n=1 Tax=Plectonema cf. radiosum LEGE 06105 TaxID=945769 RepID=A0A8J7F582_9CYAN|nr:hypothetical protein [Plectonema radiosum]MBE9213920.1 hypothetical protein [Plectonema cf. radiosum LEGE 06105]
MLNNFRKTFILVAVVATLSTGCKYSKQYQKLSEAGDKYTIAVDELLNKASELQIDLSSEKLLLNDRISNQTLTDYEDSKKRDREMLVVIEDISEHNRLLTAYFSTLRELAHSDTPEITKEKIEDIATNLETIGIKLQKNSLFPGKSVLGNIGKLIVHSKINGVLREELEQRNPLILKELTIQQEMLKALGEIMNNNINELQNQREQLLVILPLTEKQPISHELLSQWTQTRKKMFLMNRQVRELNQASFALEGFKEIYQASVEGKVKSQSLNDALKDIDYFLALLGK